MLVLISTVCGRLIFSDYHKALTQRQQLDGQLNENTAVKQVRGYQEFMDQNLS
jgi:hypothetical protein